MTPRTRRIAVVTVAAAWWLLLAVAFLRNRGDDIGRLPSLIRSFVASLAEGPIWSPRGLATSLAGVVVAGLIAVAWYGLGAWILRRIPWARPRKPQPAPLPAAPLPAALPMDLAASTLLGAAVWSIIWFFLGVGYLYRPSIAWLALVAGLGSGMVAVARLRPSPRRMAHAAGRGLLGLIVTGQVLALTAALAPPTAKDTLLYHFALPKAYLAAGGAPEVPYNIAGYYPLGVEMHAVWAMLLGAPFGPRVGEAAAGATLFLFAPLLVMVVYGWAREHADPGWAAAATLMVAWVPTVYDVAASAYVDLALAAYTALAISAFGRWWSAPAPRHLVWVAAGVGGALSIKLSAAFMILPLAALALLRALRPGHDPADERSTPGALALPAASALALGVALAAPWYVRNWLRTGSPLFPFYLGIWPAQAPGWDLERSQLYEALFSLYGDTRTTLDYVLTPLRLAVAAQPDQPPFYDGVLGFAVAFALPLLAWALWTNRLAVELRLAALISGCLFGFWLFSSQQLRYLLPALPGLAVATAAAGAALGDATGRWLRWLLLSGAALGLPVVLAWFLILDPVRVALGGESRADYLGRRLDYYPYYEVVNQRLPAAARVWLIDMRRDTYHLERPYFSDFIFEDYTLTRYVRAAASPDEVRARVEASGITHVLVRHDLLFDYRRSPIVDEGKTREQNQAKLELMAGFFTQGTRLLKGDQKFWLIELPRRPGG
jgi:hypothetical protein